MYEGNQLVHVILQDLTLQEAETIALSILKQVMEEKVSLSSPSVPHSSLNVCDNK